MNQRERIVQETDFLLSAEHVAKRFPGESATLRDRVRECASRDDGLVDLIQSSLEVRHLIASADPSDTWRDCLSWIGPPPESPRTIDYEYMRSDQRLGPSAPWRRYYPWLANRSVAAVPMLHNSCMASIASFFMALSHANDGVALTVLASRLYYESRQLLDRLLPGTGIEVIELDDDGVIRELRARRGKNERVVVWLDTAETSDTVDVFRRIASLPRELHPLTVGWDNTLIPLWSAPLPGQDWPPYPVFLARSLHKLDQLGLELASVGLLTIVSPRSLPRPAAELMRGVMQDLVISSKTLGATAAPRDLRLLSAIGLPHVALAEASNTAALSACERFADGLAERLPRELTVLKFPHNCFVTVRCSGQDVKGTHALMADVIARAQGQRLPVQRAASIGFSFTGMSVFTGQDPIEGDEAVFLRIAVGGHDHDVLDSVLNCFVDTLAQHRVS